MKPNNQLDNDRAYINSYHRSIQEVRNLPPSVRRFLMSDAKMLNSQKSEMDLWRGYVRWISKWEYTIARLCLIEDYETAARAQEIIEAETDDFLYAIKHTKFYHKDETEEMIAEVKISAWINAYETIYAKPYKTQ
jgi:hypothetical protein